MALYVGDEHNAHRAGCYKPGAPLRDLCDWCRKVLTTEPVPASSLPPFSSWHPRCAKCSNTKLIRVHYDRACHEVDGEHYHRHCPCGHSWLEQCSERKVIPLRR